MRASRTVIVGLCTAVTAILVLTATKELPAQLPMEPVKKAGQSVTGAFEGWYKNPDGSFSILVGYFNRNTEETLDIPVGPNNRIEPGGPDMGQPTHFLPRRQWGVFTITVPKDFGNKKLTWTLVANGQTTTVPLNLNPLWIVSPFKEAGVGNTPPVLTFEPGGRTFTGPPQGMAMTTTAKAATPLTLTMWAKDDGVRAPEAGNRGGGTPVTISWSKYRGPGAVTFSNARPPLEAEGKVTTTATFATPGEYILRAQANDSTGQGGGGFQCCWTNVHVKVSVAP
jgi:hypothetical protein